MKKVSMLIVGIITLFITVGSVETVDAQGRGRGRGKSMVRVYHPVVVRRAHVRYSNMPRWGAVITTMPPSAVMIRSNRNQYYFHNGIYYTPRNSGFVIVRPTRGLRISMLPVGYRTVVVGPGNYYYYYGTYYAKAENGNEYKVVDPPVGAVVDALPDGYEVKKIDGTEYYVLDDVYYAEVDVPDFEDHVGYEVVKR